MRRCEALFQSCNSGSGQRGEIYDALRSKMSGSAQKEKCPKTNLKSQGVLCEAYTFIVVYIIYCAQMAHIQGVNVPLHSKTGL